MLSSLNYAPLFGAALLAGNVGIVAACGRQSKDAASTGCLKDTDCKGDRVCEHGQCTTPSAAAASTAPSPSPVASTTVRPLLPQSREVSAEKSQYGRFTVVADASNCIVSFKSASGQSTRLFEVPTCTAEGPGLAVVDARTNLGALPFPAIGPDGDEFHLFEIGTSRGGNGIAGNDYWAVVVRPAAVWATEKPFADGELLAAELVTSVPTALVVEESATTTSAGVRYTVKFGATTKVVLPMLPSSVVSKTTTVLAGDLQGGFHASGYRPFVSVGDKWTIIDENGPCRVPALGEDMGQVRLHAEVSTWSDGRSTLKCLSMQR